VASFDNKFLKIHESRLKSPSLLFCRLISHSNAVFVAICVRFKNHIKTDRYLPEICTSLFVRCCLMAFNIACIRTRTTLFSVVQGHTKISQHILIAYQSVSDWNLLHIAWH